MEWVGVLVLSLGWKPRPHWDQMVQRMALSLFYTGGVMAAENLSLALSSGIANCVISACVGINWYRCDSVFHGIRHERTLHTVYPRKYAHGFVVLCFVVVMQSFIMNSHEVFIHIHQSCFAGTGAIVRLPQCQWSKPDGYGKISQCITTTKHSKTKTVCIFLGIYCYIYCVRSPTVGRGSLIWDLLHFQYSIKVASFNVWVRYFVRNFKGTL